MRWEQGRATLQQMIDAKELQRVPASREHADRLLAESQRHIASARDIVDLDPEGAYQLLYDGVRKALTAILANEGLRPTTSGGHRAVYTALAAQLDPPMGGVLRPFDRMRRQRHSIEYPAMDAEPVLPEDVVDELPKAEAIIDLAGKILDQMSPF
jgi:hypothetical protein